MNGNGEKLNGNIKKLNGKSGWVTALAGIPLAVMITWVFSTGVVKGTSIERLNQLERRMERWELAYERTSVAIGKMQVNIGKICVKLEIQDDN